jgi:hypothetical protein
MLHAIDGVVSSAVDSVDSSVCCTSQFSSGISGVAFKVFKELMSLASNLSAFAYHLVKLSLFVGGKDQCAKHTGSKANQKGRELVIWSR